MNRKLVHQKGLHLLQIGFHRSVIRDPTSVPDGYKKKQLNPSPDSRGIHAALDGKLE